MVLPDSRRIPRALRYLGHIIHSNYVILITGLSPSMAGFPTPFFYVVIPVPEHYSAPTHISRYTV